MAVVEDAPTTKRERWTMQWKELFDEVVTTGLCTGCAGCVIACPHDVLGYDHQSGGYRPFHIEEELGPDDCIHGQKGCTSCTRACPRFRTWETEADEHLFGRVREAEEVSGIYSDVLLTRASDDMVHEVGQDGGLVSAILLWAMRNGYIDAALVSYLEGDGSSWKAIPGVAANEEEIIKTAGSRYTYSANTLAIDEALERGFSKLALVGMSCQSSVPPVMWHRKVGKISKPIVFNIGLLCSKTFDDAIFEELFEAKYGLKKQDMVKMNIKGVFQIWMKDGAYHEVPLKECHQWTREGCNHCPDFAAEHADISTGGIGKYNDWTLTIVRTELGREIIQRMIADGSIQSRPGEDDPAAIELMHKLSIKSRKRWPETAVPTPRLGVPPPKPKADAVASKPQGEPAQAE
jgi:coenzyme F420 hydrogenase subunit beta